MFFIGFTITFYPFNHMPHAIDITNLMSSKIYCYYLKRYLNNFYGSDIAESSRTTSLSMLDNTIYNNSIFNTKHVEFPKKWISAPSFFTTLLIYKITPTITTNYPLLYFNQFSPLLFHTTIRSIPTKTSFC